MISDRFLLSTVVYQSIGGDVRPETLWEIGRLANDGIEPQLTILLDMPAKEAIKRMKQPADRMERRGVNYMESVRQAFLEQLPQSSPATAVINANQSAEQVDADIQEALQQFLLP